MGLAKDFAQRKGIAIRRKQIQDLVQAVGREMDVSDPRVLNTVLVLQELKDFVFPLCGGRWLDFFGDAGNCQVCGISVGRTEQGLRCENMGHWLCWPCLAENVDHEKLQFASEKMLNSLPSPDSAWERELNVAEEHAAAERRDNRFQAQTKFLVEAAEQRRVVIKGMEELWCSEDKLRRRSLMDEWRTRCSVLRDEWDAYAGLRDALLDRFGEASGFAKGFPEVPRDVELSLPPRTREPRRLTLSQWSSAFQRARQARRGAPHSNRGKSGSHVPNSVTFPLSAARACSARSRPSASLPRPSSAPSRVRSSRNSMAKGLTT